MKTIELSPEHLHEVAEKPATREVVPLLDGESFRWMEHDYPAPIARWNYHPEVEIHLIRRSAGSYIIGDQIGAFRAGHVAIVGAGVPHDWMSDLSAGEVIVDRDAVIQFNPSWLEQSASVMPELQRALSLVEQAGRGIIYSGETAVAAGREIEAVGVAHGAARLVHFFVLLEILLDAPEHERHFVAEQIYSASAGTAGKTAVDAGLSYVLENFSGDIRMSEAARLAYMSEPTFSKYFKKASGMTFSQLVRRLRIANACRMLDRTETSVTEICAAVGYNSLANFNRQFRAETGLTPSEYRRLDPSQRPSTGLVGLKQGLFP